MAVSNKKDSEFTPSLRSHIIAALLSTGVAAIILWLASGMTLAAVIVDSFSLGFYIGFMLLMSAAPAVLASPVILPGLLLIVSGLILGGAAATFAHRLKSNFGLAQNNTGNGLSNELTKDKSELLVSYNDLQCQSDCLESGNTLSQQNKDNPLGKQHGFMKFWGSLGLTSLVSSGSTALLGWLATDFVVSLSIIPVFLLGMTLAIVLVPLSIALSGIFALPAFTALMFALGGFATGAFATTLATYFLSDNQVQGHPVEPIIRDLMEKQCEGQISHQKILNGLKKDKLNLNEEVTNTDLNEQKTGISKLSRSDDCIKAEAVNTTEEYSFCGLRF
ncbi:TPA: hypothetical protein ACT96X_000547 [Legionella pneumophila]|uniref:hypothetical protein n=1 Tax=Legionella pneumophila TaxID=446 RepID=UPI00078963A6|nr:hypothetical protein [Legionella pneumophila]MDW9167722.1 hypothetical protein [Legionella pneumophila subsp. fraseri]MDX1846183.1 hypothetical protein [Legionella pneumophila subsp. fraseri]HAT1658201.1 hypothetical protein [Legionella pneumophila]HAT1772206.1 hypothetical protein [Legionella pneumophila]HAT1881856.1 hypothetical protein [Legionella pneumophila]